MKLLIVAGESSGDLHGAALARELLQREPTLDLLGVGGEKMRTAGVRNVGDVTAYAAVGLVEPLRNLMRFTELYRRLISVLRRERPDAVVLIDFPEFNLRFAERVKDAGIPLVYYISPQVWAWRPWRIHRIVELVDRMVVFFDFERELYAGHGQDVTWVGHPLVDLLAEAPSGGDLRRDLGIGADGLLVGLLPGSRVKEVERLMPVMAGGAALMLRQRPDARFVVGCAPNIDPGWLRRFLPGDLPIDVVADRTYDVMRSSTLLLVASGTATLEAAVFGTPMVMMYRLAWLSYLVARLLVQIRSYSLVNIVARKAVIPELIQYDATPARVAAEALAMLEGGRLEAIRRELADVRNRLGAPGASGRAADAVLDLMRTRSARRG